MKQRAAKRVKSNQAETAAKAVSIEIDETGDPYDVAHLYLSQRFPDLRTVADFLHRAAISGNTKAQFELANLILESAVSRTRYGSAMSWYQSASSAGMIDATIKIAEMYYSGTATIMDRQKSFDLYFECAKNGHAQAQFQIGLFYQQGLLVPISTKKAAHWFCQAAKQGHAMAREYLAPLYLLKIIRLHEMQSQEDRWFLQALYDENPSNWVSLGLAYLRGTRLQRNDSEAIFWLCRAAQHGSGKAMFNLAVMRLEGLALPQDHERGVKLMKASAEAGYEPASNWLIAHAAHD